MKKSLAIITEVDVIWNNEPQTRNPWLDEIFYYYSKFFEEIHILGPGLIDAGPVRNSKTGIFYYSTRLYSKSIKKRLMFLILKKERCKLVQQFVFKCKPVIIQLRIPGIFTNVLYGELKKQKIPITTYIAGDWGTSFPANYKSLFSNIVGKFLDKWQKLIVKSTIPVAAGPVLAEKFSYLRKTYSYFSTTHVTTNQINKKWDENRVFQLIGIGRIEELKRFQDAIEAVYVLINDRIRVNLTLVGDGPLKQILENSVREKGLDQYITFKGFIKDRDQINHLLKNSDFLILPSLSEGTPKVIPEAMSYGVIPIAVRDTGSIRYIIVDGVNGFLVNKKAPLEIAGCIKSVISNDEFYTKLSKNALNYAEAHTLGKEVQGMWEFIFNELGKKEEGVKV